jgi:trehalose 6-phosphate synthase
LLLGLIAAGLIPLVESLTVRWFARDLDIRASLIASTVQESLVAPLRERSTARVSAVFTRLIQDERLYAVGFCDSSGKLVYRTSTLPQSVRCPDPGSPIATEGEIQRFPQGPLHVSHRLIEDGSERLGTLLLTHDLSFVQRRSDTTRNYIFGLFLAIVAIVSTATVVIARLSIRGWVTGLRSLLRGEGLFRTGSSMAASPELKPFVKDLRALIRDLDRDRKARDEDQISWNPKALKELLHRELAGDEVLIVSNRQPYIHNRVGDEVVVQVPASGLVTALEPVMRACSGTWIAHGNGSADKAVVDSKDHVQVPPGEPSYQIRRLWLSKEEETGYYYGFANEGLWPLCHIAHTRPIFRSSDWKQYVAVNQKFADAVVDESKTDNPVVLVQDYHFALLPKMVREKLPKATIIAFWHIPWPNPEAFGICPWREELLDGLLGSSILGFHTRFHCNNFIDTVDRFMEARIDRETSTISYGGKLTAVNHYPISIEWPSRFAGSQRSIRECRARVRSALGVPQDLRLGIGVDRLDYTKGILERFMAVERLLEMRPEWIGKFSFLQIAAPSRSTIEQYQDLDGQVRALAGRINRRFGRDGYAPIILKIEHHEAPSVFEHFRASDLCFVSSLHDGMNLVAKEFVSARDDEMGVLILSQFTGAARELPEALIVNPYNIDQCASALQLALEMPASEQKDRMRSMRGLIQEFNVFRWAGRMLIDAARIRQQNRFAEKIREVKPLLPRILS